MSYMKIEKPWKLETEGLTDVKFERWKNKLESYLETDPKNRKFLEGGKYDEWVSAEKNSLRILSVQDATTETQEMLEEYRVELRRVLSAVADYVHEDYFIPIIRHSTSFKWIYKKLRRDNSIQHKGIHFLAINKLAWDPEIQSPIGFYNAYRSVIMANLVSADTKVEWADETSKEDEKMSYSFEDLILCNVLTLLHPKLPAFVEKKFHDKIRDNKRLMDYKDEILEQAKEMIEEIETPQLSAINFEVQQQQQQQPQQQQQLLCGYIPPPRQEYRQNRQFRPRFQPNKSFQPRNSMQPYKPRFTRQPFQQQPRTRPHQQQNTPFGTPPPFCRVCHLSGLPKDVYTSHFLGQQTCPSLSSQDKNYLLQRTTAQLSALQVDDDDDDGIPDWTGYGNYDQEDQLDQVKVINTSNDSIRCNFIQPIPSQILTVQDKNHANVNLDLDSGANVSHCKLEAVQSYGFKIRPNGQLSNLADGKTKMAAIGEVDEIFYRNDWQVRYHAIVVKDLHCDFIAGTNFIKNNKVIQDFDSKTITVHKKYTVSETSRSLVLPTQANNLVLQNNHINVLVPGRDLDLLVPHSDDTLLAVQACYQNKSQDWPKPQICSVKNGHILIKNDSQEPIAVKKNNVKIQVRTLSNVNPNLHPNVLPAKALDTNVDNTSLIEVNAENIDPKVIAKVNALHHTYKDVFNDDLSVGYNHRFGKHLCRLNWAGQKRPAAHKLQTVNYDYDTKQLLQEVIDDLTNKNVLAVPQDYNISVQYCSPAFLVRKPKAKNKAKQDLCKDDFRMVVNFSQINEYLKNIPSTVTKPKDIFLQLGRWNYIISLDLASGFFQNHMSMEDSQWLGICSPFGGLRILTRSGQGLLGQSEELDIMLSKVLGVEMADGIVARLADDIYVGGNTPQETVDNYERVLQKLQAANIKVSAGKTKVFLNSIDVLGWKWQTGSFLSPSPHRVNALQNSKFEDIKTVKNLRSWLGLYKTLLPASPNLTLLLDPFDKAVADRDSKESIEWDRDLINSFIQATQAVKKLQTLYLPHPQDPLLIEVDAAKINAGIGHTVYAIKDGKKLPVAFHSSKLSENHAKWQACELEALAFANAINSEFDLLRECKSQIIVSPDSKPVSDAFKLIKKGRYSTNPRIQSFLSNVNRIPITVQLASGKSGQNISADFQSRNASKCTSQHCSLCNFVKEASDGVILPSCNAINADNMNNRQAWKSIQDQQKSTKDAKYLITTGKTPNKMSGKINSEIRRLCSPELAAEVTKDNLLVVPSKSNKYSATQVNRTVIPSSHLPALIWQMHNTMQHPTKSQLKAAFDKNFYSVGLASALDKLYDECFFCSTQRKIPISAPHATITDVQVPGTYFHCDVIRRQKQFIFAVRDHFSTFTAAKFVKNESSSEFKQALIDLIVPIKNPGKCTVRVDNARGFLPLLHDKCQDLKLLQIYVEALDPFNKNNNAVIDRGCFELEQEIKKAEPEGKPISNSTLQMAVSRLNSLLRRNGQISSFEIHFNRCQNTGEGLNLNYGLIRSEQLKVRNLHNERHNDKLQPQKSTPVPKPGDIVLTKAKPDKHKAKDLYVVTSTDDSKVSFQKILRPYSNQAQLRSHVYTTEKNQLFVAKPSQTVALPPLKTDFVTSAPKQVSPAFSDDSDDDDAIFIPASYNISLPQVLERTTLSRLRSPPPPPPPPPPLPPSPTTSSSPSCSLASSPVTTTATPLPLATISASNYSDNILDSTSTVYRSHIRVQTVPSQSPPEPPLYTHLAERLRQQVAHHYDQPPLPVSNPTRHRSNSEPSYTVTPGRRTPARRHALAARQAIYNTYHPPKDAIGHQHDGPISLPASRDHTPPRQASPIPHRRRLLSTHDTPYLSSHPQFDFDSDQDHLEWDAHVDWDDILPYDNCGTIWDNVPETVASRPLHYSVGSPSEIEDLNAVYKLDRLLDKYWRDFPSNSQ